MRWATGLSAVFGLLYLMTAARHLLGGDAGEFGLVAGTGGYAHPPSYPLYSFFLWLVGRLPVSTPAHEAAMATGLLGALAIGVFYLACRAWGASRPGGLFGAVLFGLAPEIWLLHTIPEAFALNHIVAASILYLAAPDGPVSGRARIVGLGLAAAVGVAHHHMIVLMIPIGVFGVWRGVRESEHHPARLVAEGLGCVLLGFVPYLYLVWVSHAVPDAYHWGTVASWSDFVHVFLRRDYGTFALNAGEVQTTAVEQVVFLAKEASADLMYVGVMFAGIGAVWGLYENPGSDGKEQRVGLAAVLAAWLLSGPVFVSLIGREGGGPSYLHLRKFHAQFELLTLIFVALGATWLFRRFSRRWFVGSIVGATILAGISYGLPYLDDHTGPTLEQYVHDLLSPLPENSVLVGDSDHRFFAIAYTQRVLGRRTDVQYLDESLLGLEWYRKRLGSDLEIETAIRDGTLQLDLLFERMIDRGRPVFATHFFHPNLGDEWAVFPHGVGFRIRRPKAGNETLQNIYDRNRSLAAGFSIEPRPNVPATSWNHFILSEYGRTWMTMADRLRDAGEVRRAREAEAFVRELAPWLDKQ